MPYLGFQFFIHHKLLVAVFNFYLDCHHQAVVCFFLGKWKVKTGHRTLPVSQA